ncbi:MAG: hypothetical protein J07HQX50_02526 [Haloquadratum sp. J07HQX50]|nr:MAG: hypothetical protein J07HQX50_02526 [Haloquadratum sp. J07HQX50]
MVRRCSDSPIGEVTDGTVAVLLYPTARKQRLFVTRETESFTTNYLSL